MLVHNHVKINAVLRVVSIQETADIGQILFHIIIFSQALLQPANLPR